MARADVGGSDDALVVGVSIFGSDQVGISRHTVQRLPQQHLTLVVYLGGVEEIDAVVKRAPDESPGGLSRRAAPLPEQARATGALRHQRHREPGATEPSIFHFLIPPAPTVAAYAGLPRPENRGSPATAVAASGACMRCRVPEGPG